MEGKVPLLEDSDSSPKLEHDTVGAEVVKVQAAERLIAENGRDPGKGRHVDSDVVCA